MLELKNVSFLVDAEGKDKEIIRDVSLTVPDRKLVVVTGPNGGGKSTLARLIAGIEKPTEGRIFFNGEDITDLGVTERARKGIECALSCQRGAVRLYRRLRIGRKEDMRPVEVAAAEILNDHLADYPELDLPETWVGTGGTFTTLAAMILGQPWTDRTRVHGAEITSAEIRDIGETLAGMKVEDRIRLQGLQPSRADIVVHGICILLGVMERLGIDRITVSEWGNLDGYVRKYFCGSAFKEK